MLETKKIKSITSVRKFYFLDYFYILLLSVDRFWKMEEIFESFKILKQLYQLGESKYKKLTSESMPTKKQLDRYRYTLEQVIEEAKEYYLISEEKNGKLELTKSGIDLLKIAETKGNREFNLEIFRLMENQYEAFKYIINFAYEANKHKPGLLIFPNYSPSQMGIARKSIKCKDDIIQYLNSLVQRLEYDLEKFIGRRPNLVSHTNKIVNRLENSELLGKNKKDIFNPRDYNKIIKRIRDYWLAVFLKDIYHYEFSASSFDFWIYRGKQIGIIQVSEFFPNFSGRIVYPTSIISEKVNDPDFESLYEYDNGQSLFVHSLMEHQNDEKFVDTLVKYYFDLRKSYRGYFINLLALRELVCYSLKISDYVFEKLLNEVYKLNILGKLKIKISLEVDRLPEETKAIYLKREPVIVDGQVRNIIGIDVTKGGRKR
ncbi:MAG: hypothetical protein OEZ13_08570 [Spirochaetia bacterium]|nr:hypothetical protein [Spirochaetia bacterium]